MTIHPTPTEPTLVDEPVVPGPPSALGSPVAPDPWVVPDPPTPAVGGNRAVSWPTPPPHPTPRWARWALLGLLAGTALLYLWNLSINGWANSYYSAAAQAGGESWKAWFFGSLDAANSITVDKPPGSLWVMGLSVRIFGLSSWSVLVPQALIGVASVGMLYATVRRWFGAPAGLIAGTVLALTPVAALMFRFNNPDALLVLLLVLAAWAMGRATEGASMRWIVLAGAFVGFAFLTKMMQAFLVLPGFVAMYAIAAPTDLKRRIGHLLAAFAAMVVAGGWWVAIVELWPADSRPYIGGSQTNSVLELIFGYNGFGRLTGDEVGSVGGGGQGGQWGETGLGRMFNPAYGGQIAWLLPAASVMIGVLLWVSRRGARTDLTRAGAIGWGGWLVATGAVISFGAGIIHEYYTVALAPAIGALVGIGSVALWVGRHALWSRITAAVVVGGSAAWAAVLLGRSEQFLPWLGPVVLVSGLSVAALILIAPLIPAHWGHRLALGAGVAGLLVLLAGPTAYSLETVATENSGSLPSAGPAVAGSRFGGAGGPGRGPGGRGGPQGNGQGASPQGASPQGGFPQGGPGGGFPPGGNGQGGGQGNGQLPWIPGGGQGGAMPGTGNGGGAGSLLQGSEPTQQITDALLADADSFTWVAATVGANAASGYQLSTQEPVMAIGGFNGSDPSPTLEQFQHYVAEGKIHWFIASGRGGLGGGRGQMGGSQEASEISAWVQSTFAGTTIDGVTMYDLTQASATSPDQGGPSVQA